MAVRCPVCGEKVGGMLGLGMPEPSNRMIEKAKAGGFYQEHMCATCLLQAAKERGATETREDFLAKEEALKEALPKALSKVFISSLPPKHTYQSFGLVTGYCILGTGPFSTLFSTVTDTFGIKSNAYFEKIRIAEKEALDMLKFEALKLGADSVYGVHVNLTEATSGNGMLMISVSGDAIKNNSSSQDILTVIEILKKI